VLLQRGAIKPV